MVEALDAMQDQQAGPLSDVLRPLSDAVSSPLTKAYRVGGFGLAFLVLGAILFSAAVVSPRGVLSYFMASVGLLLIAVPCYFFYVKEIRPIASAQRQVAANADLIDSVQEVALSTTYAAYDIQALAYKYADDVRELLRVARPAMERLPVLNKIARSPQFEQADWLTGAIVDVTERAERIIGDVRQALIDADPTALKKYALELDGLRTELRRLLRGAGDGSEVDADGPQS
jgi:hypothetical protein